MLLQFLNRCMNTYNDLFRTFKKLVYIMIDPQILSFHLMLLNDAARMQAYRKAVFNTVKQGDTVLDVGTGSGILAMFACQAGAKRVYAVDRGDVISMAEELAKANSFDDRIVFLKQDIKQLRLDEQVDVITSELIAKSVLGQNMAELIGFCRDRFLKPDGKILPAQVKLHVAPIENKKIYGDARPPDENEYDLDFTPLEQLSINKPVSTRIAADTLMAQDQIAYSYDALTAADSDTFGATLIFNPQRKGTLHGFAGWFSTVLSEGIELNNKPPGMKSWDNLFFPLARAIEVEPGTFIELNFRGQCDSEVQEFWVWNTTVRKGDEIIAQHRQSSFAGRIITAEILRKANDNWTPTANSNGKIAQVVLECMRQNMSLREIAEQISDNFPEQFGSAEQAIAQARKIAEQFGD
jgi:protein arginine N-methyltransferase 1